MCKNSVNVTDFVYGSKRNACNFLHTISLQNGVVFLEGAQETKIGRNQSMVPTFFYACPDRHHLSFNAGIVTPADLSKSTLYKGVARSNDCRNDSAVPAEISTWTPLHSTIATVKNRGAMFSSFVSVFVYGKIVLFSYTNRLVNNFNSIKYNQQTSKHL